MNSDLELGYLGMEVPDPDGLTTFLGDVVGLVPGAPTSAGADTWRNDRKARRLIIEQGSAGDAVYLGFEAADDAAFDAIVDRLDTAGFATVAGDSALCEERAVRRIITAQAPFGVQVEVVVDLADGTGDLDTPLMPGGFLTEGVGFGHAVVATTAFDESVRFFTQGLGMCQSDWVETEIADGIPLEVSFLHCNARHHSIAVARAPFELPTVLHHVMLEVNDWNDVGAAFDRAWATDLAIPNGLGRHDNDQMFSFYVESPAGFQVEIGQGARRITEQWDDNRKYDRISSWGHQPLRSA